MYPPSDNFMKNAEVFCQPEFKKQTQKTQASFNEKNGTST